MFDLPPVTPSVEITVASDGIYQGVTQTGGEAQVVGKARLTAGKVYVEAGAKNVDLNTGADTELSLAAGAGTQVGGVSVAGAVIYRNYLGTVAGVTQDQIEYQAAAARDFGKVATKVTYTYTPDAYGPAKQAHFVEFGAGTDIVAGTRVSAAVGRREQDGSADYTVWNVGLTQTLSDNLSADVRYYEADVVDRYTNADNGRVVVSLRAAF